MALDVGERRLGVAIADESLRFAKPLTTLIVNDNVGANLQQLISTHVVRHLVIGLPRNLDGESTPQTATVRAFIKNIRPLIADMPISWQDEALTSQRAIAELRSKGKPFEKGDIDALAATYILEDFLLEHPAGVSL